MRPVSTLRGAWNMLLVAGLTIAYSLRAFASRLGDATGDGVIDLARRWARTIARTTAIDVRTETRGALDPTRPYVFMANHTSAADIWALYVGLPVRVRMIAKKQLGRVPFLGWAMRAGRFIFIDRQNAAAARRSIDEAARRIAGGDSVLLFPEGTRSRDGTLRAFKKGGFHLAMTAGVPIVPVGVRGAREVLPPDTLFPRPGTIEVVIGEPIETARVPESARDALIERVRQEVADLVAGEVINKSRAEA